MKFVSSQEVIEFHDRLISRDGGVAGMPEPGRADAIICLLYTSPSPRD